MVSSRKLSFFESLPRGNDCDERLKQCFRNANPLASELHNMIPTLDLRIPTAFTHDPRRLWLVHALDKITRSETLINHSEFRDCSTYFQRRSISTSP